MCITIRLWLRLQNREPGLMKFVTGIAKVAPEICLKSLPRELLLESSAIRTTFAPVLAVKKVILLVLLPTSSSPRRNA